MEKKLEKNWEKFLGIASGGKRKKNQRKRKKPKFH